MFIYFKEIKNATCIGPMVNEEANQITISCKVEKVLTNLVCLFYDHQNVSILVTNINELLF